ncbi:MAG TPA: sulfotransferase [Solirubrobacteraceae bacterium]|nr:sulfotransferase [Solirubrobacteraceae bacterium]
MIDDFRLLMLSAMYENGGNTTHRFLDGHPQLHVYPFESQIGTAHVNDGLTSMFPTKYRWPEFLLSATPAMDYHAIIDEEAKVRSRTPHVSKFRHEPFEMDDDERRDIYCSLVESSGRSRGANVAAFFRATHQAWRDERGSGEEQMYVGYSPVIAVDTAKILADLPGAHVLHVVRNPWSAYADTKKRPKPLSLTNYMLRWNLHQHFALTSRALDPERVHVVRIEDVMEDPSGVLGELLESIGLGGSETLGAPSWNGQQLQEVYPWGTLRAVSPEANRATAAELTEQEIAQIRALAWQYLDEFSYADFLASATV